MEKEYPPVLEELGIGLVCFSPLGRGYLTGKTSGEMIVLLLTSSVLKIFLLVLHGGRCE